MTIFCGVVLGKDTDELSKSTVVGGGVGVARSGFLAVLFGFREFLIK